MTEDEKQRAIEEEACLEHDERMGDLTIVVACFAAIALIAASVTLLFKSI